MPVLTQASPLPATPAALWMRLRAQFARVTPSHAQPTRPANLFADDANDTVLSLEDFRGVQAYDPALPFFLQSSFGRR